MRTVHIDIKAELAATKDKITRYHLLGHPEINLTGMCIKMRSVELYLES